MANRVNSSGTLRMSSFFDVFGTPPGKNLGAYRVSETYGHLTNLPLDHGIPQSGTIRFSNFYGKRVNVIVDFYTIENFTTRRIARNRFNGNNYSIVGRFRSTISTGNGNTSGARVILNLNRVIGSEKGDIGKVALRTGSWESDTRLELDIGGSGGLIGAGGNGGTRRSGAASNGTSALGLQYPTAIVNRGYIQGGMGGGGGGGTGYGRKCQRSQRGCDGCYQTSSAGGGGAGGAGFPSGNGSGNGSDGNLNSGGEGGAGNVDDGGSCWIPARGGNGGNGGSTPNSPGQQGQTGGDNGGNAGGARGQSGYAIIINGSGSSTLSNIAGGTTGGGQTSSVSIL